MLIERRVDFAKDDPTHRGHASMSAERWAYGTKFPAWAREPVRLVA